VKNANARGKRVFERTVMEEVGGEEFEVGFCVGEVEEELSL